MTQRRWWVAATAAIALTTVTVGTEVPAAGAEPAAVSLATGETGLVRLRIPNEAMADELVAVGADVAARPRSGGEVLIDLVLTDSQLAELTARGAQPVQLIQRERDGSNRYAQSLLAAQAKRQTGITAQRHGTDGAAVTADTSHSRRAQRSCRRRRHTSRHARTHAHRRPRRTTYRARHLPAPRAGTPSITVHSRPA